MRELSGKRVLITGAADGIGKGAAYAFAREGSRLLLADIDSEKLEAVANELRRRGADCRAYTVDVADDERVARMAAAVEADVGGVDVLVNVAGVCVVADLAETSLDDWRWIVGINMFGPVHTISAFLPGMRRQGSGHIVNVASAGGLVHFGIIGAYCTTKAGLVALSAALDQEVHDEGVGVTAFCPGITGTAIVERMRFTGYRREKLLRVWDWLFRTAITPEKTGELIVSAVRRGRPLVVTTFFAKVVVMLNKVAPGLVRYALRRGKRMNDRLYR